MIEVGIGITTYKRPIIVELCVSQIEKHTRQPFKLFVSDDTKTERGVAYNKNLCLDALKGSKHIFLFDDDCFPISDDWVDFFTRSKINHLLYLENRHRKISGSQNYLIAGGVFLYISKEAFETVGYFNNAYGRYGYEHSAYSQRIYKSGLIPHPFISLDGTNEKLFSFDYENKPFNGICSTPNFSDSEKMKLTQVNECIYNDEIKSGKIYYEFVR